MKLRAPSGCASLCHDGEVFVVAPDGSIEVNDDMVAALVPHGFVPHESQAAESVAAPHAAPSEANDIDAMTRGELFRFLRSRGIRTTRRDTNARLRAAARRLL